MSHDEHKHLYTRRSAVTSFLALAVPSRKRNEENSAYHCTRCGRAIFHAKDLVRKVTLWDYGTYQAECYEVRKVIDGESLTRLDVSLHQGWYCCRFILMRMVVDKFGTGDALLVYVDSVVKVRAGDKPPTRPEKKGQMRLSARDFASVTSQSVDELRVVKFGAIWCPPCRLVDHALGRIATRGGIPGVRFFEVDSDEEPALAEHWGMHSLPFFVFYYKGQQLQLSAARLPVRNGLWVGGIGEAQIESLTSLVRDRARSQCGQTVTVSLD